MAGMLRYLKNGEIDTVKWDQCVSRAFNGNPCGYSWYLDKVCPEWSGIVQGDFERVMPLPSWSKGSVHYLMQPFFTQQLGVFSQLAISPETVKSFVEFIPGHFRYIDINLNSFNTFTSNDFQVSEQVNYELDLIESYEVLEGRYNSNLKRNLKKAKALPLSLSKSVRPDDVVKLFRENKGESLKLLKDEQYDLMLKLVYTLVHKGMCEVWGAYDEHNQLVAGIFWVFSHQKAIFLFSAVSSEGKEQLAMPWMIDQFIRENSGSAVTLDFEGSNDGNLARFYGSFGSKMLHYPRLYKNALPLHMNIALKAYRFLRTLKK